ncbi:AI-2E family transporter [Mucilaginibacter arboris]|uniref:AI-2E family transporter n=1 Tax=Mucilaginibacter arboris TaxID=2682090 RepID=A0A7K1SU30_9SPHI|nr:AI-2E family transporter [Mucilaginibacter arboris]MVN20842.1 AI-2E family transporter [Mucilaginibacter arboris]
MALKSVPPFYTKLAMVLVSILALGYLAIHGKELLAPLIFAMLFSILLLPLAKFFENKVRLPRGAACGLSVILLIAAVGGIIYLVGSQISNLASDWPQLRDQVTTSFGNLQDWIAEHYDINAKKQMNYVHSATSKILDSSTVAISTTVLSLSSILLFLIFMMIDTFFLLLYRRLLMRFLVAVFKKDNSTVVYDVVERIQFIIRKYIIGLILEMTIVATVVCTVFLIGGIKYAFLLGLITGLFNIIPYIGIFTALLLSVLITFSTAAVGKVLLVLITIVAMHLIDSNILLPVIVGSKVKINALITILGVIIGEMLWGIPGMFLSIPVIAMTKIIFDRIESLKPWGVLLGDEEEPSKHSILHRKGDAPEAEVAGK